MKIDLIITELAVGGAEQCLANLALALHEQSHAVRVFVLGRKPPIDRDRLWKLLESHAIDVRFLGGARWWHFPLVFFRLWKAVHTTQPEIAQSFLFHANGLAALVYSLHRIPLVGGARVVDPRRARRWLNWLSSLVMERLVCVSQSVAKHTTEIDGVASNKIVVIENGIRSLAPPDEASTAHETRGHTPSSSYAQKQLALALTTPILLFVGRLDYQKGADVLVQQADHILTALPLHHLVFIGDGPLKVRLQTQASQCKQEARIHFVGRRNEVIRWMQSSHLLLLPTRYEGMPNVVLEAMACGLPVVSTQAEGVVELLGQAASHQAVAVGDWEQWMQRVIAIAGDPALHRQLSQENIDRCRRYFDLDEKMQEYIALYHKLLERKNHEVTPRLVGDSS